MVIKAELWTLTSHPYLIVSAQSSDAHSCKM